MNTAQLSKKDQVEQVALKLLKANNTVTTLEIKMELRKDFPGVWSQSEVSSFMDTLQSEGIFTFVDNGSHRIYSQAIATPVTPKATRVRVPVKKGGTISRTKAYELMQNNKGHFFTVVFIKKDGTERTINGQYHKPAKSSVLGYVNIKDRQDNFTIKNVNLQTLLSLRINGFIYKVK